MNMIHTDPMRRFAHVYRDLHNANIPQTENPGWTPAVDVREEAERFVIRADVPGVDPASIDITMEDGVLTMSGERAAASEEGVSYQRNERASGQFTRRFNLPESADAESVSARGENGVLEITIPKREQVKPRKITVNA